MKNQWVIFGLVLSALLALSACRNTSIRGGCDPAEDEGCVCIGPDNMSCTPGDLGCICTIEDIGDQDMGGQDDLGDQDLVEPDMDQEDMGHQDLVDIDMETPDMESPDMDPADMDDMGEPDMEEPDMDPVDMADMDPVDMDPVDMDDMADPDMESPDMEADVEPEDMADMPDMPEPPARVLYMVTMQNLTPQPLGPVVAATHDPEVHMWQAGQLASPGIKVVAEMGVPFTLYDEVAQVEGVTQVLNRGVPMTPRSTSRESFGPFPPGIQLVDHTSFLIEAEPGDVFSFASMVVATNDGFWGLDAVELPAQGTTVYYADAYDAGTEENSELSAHLDDGVSILGLVALPGDPNGNVGTATDPAQPIAAHPGIQAVGDLTVEDHGWGTHVARVMITALPAGTEGYEVLAQNFTSQPFGPMVGATHPDSLHLWQEGQLASPGIKVIAEMGMPGMFLAEAQGTAGVTHAVNSGLPTTPLDSARMTFGPFPPEVELYDHSAFHVAGAPGDVFSLASMLVITNDGFWGLDGATLPSEGVVEHMAMGYDAGTEENSEVSTDLDDGGSILGLVALPGDPNGNVGTVTDPAQPIAIHAGIQGVGDLTQENHGWTPGAPVGRVTLRHLELRQDTRCLEGAACP